MSEETKKDAFNPTTAPAIPEGSAEDSEIYEYTRVRQLRRRVLPHAALAGVISGLAAGLFRIVLAWADQLRGQMLHLAHEAGSMGWAVPVGVGMAGALISVWIVRRFAPETSGSGIPHLKGVLQRVRPLNWKRVLPIKFIAGTAALGSGLALGREGPTVQMGGAAGDLVASLLKVRPRERRTLIAAGAGSGLAGAFNAPLSGLTFVLEEIQRDFQPIVFAASFIASITAVIVARLIAGSSHVFSVPAYPTPPLVSLPFFAVLGLFCGFLGLLFNKSLLGGLNLTARLRGKAGTPAVLVVGGLVGLAGWYSPLLTGSGHGLAETVLAGEFALALIPAWFAMRFFLTVSSYGTGAAGGIFAPLLVLGALLGLGTGQVFHNIAPEAVPQPAVFAVVGMAAYFTAIVRAPLTGILLIVEMTGNYEQMLPLLVSCFCAYGVVEWLKDKPIYDALLERDLVVNPGRSLPEKPVVIDFEVQADAPFAGMCIASLGLPKGCVLVRGIFEGREFVPTATTFLEPGMKFTAVIASEANDAYELLRKGCRG